MNHDGAADFVKRFAEFWRAPVPERLDTLLAPNARLSAPMIPTTEGFEAGKQAFEDLFELISEMTAEVHRWGATSDGVLIEFTVRGNEGDRLSPGSRSTGSCWMRAVLPANASPTSTRCRWC